MSESTKKFVPLLVATEISWFLLDYDSVFLVVVAGSMVELKLEGASEKSAIKVV